MRARGRFRGKSVQSTENNKNDRRSGLRRAVGKRLHPLLTVVFVLFALLGVNSLYLVTVTLWEWAQGTVYQNWFYLVMFLVHLALGLLLLPAAVVFGALHMRNTYNWPNRRAVYVGYALYGTTLALLASGLILTRLEGILVVKDPTVRAVAYWIHVISPLVAIWLFVLHRLAGKRVRWRIGVRWAVVAAVVALLLLPLSKFDPRVVEGEGEASFFPALAETASGGFIPERVLNNAEYCLPCHEDSHATWAVSAHRFSSFNNPAYLFAVRETREVVMGRDGNLQAARFCAGCHDPVPFFSGRFDDPQFDLDNDPAGKAGLTCTACHSIVAINDLRGNASYTIEEPVHYPFAFSDNRFLRWLNEQLVVAKPELHKKTFLKPLHKTPEFCSTCHKVNLPEFVNGYKWLRGQNHYDSYHLSGVSGHGVASFYYPPKAVHACAECHMPLVASDQFSAQDFDDTGVATVHDHQFPAANTALPHLLGLPEWVNNKHQGYLRRALRLDLFGIREGGTIEGELTAPLRPQVPVLEPGRSYLLEAVVRTVGMGHLFTQGTADSNQVWVEVSARSGDRVVGRSGGRAEAGDVDPWSHFINAYVLDAQGRRIDRRNGQDIFVALYNHQIPPGAADVIHYRLDVPDDVVGPIAVEARVLYRKFDTTYMRYIYGEEYVNDLPVSVLAEDRIVFPVRAGQTADNAASTVPEWQRWNDYGIGLLRKGGKSKGQLRQAEEAFLQVEELGRPDGPLNLARVYLAQGTVRDKAVEALARAATFDPPAPSWSVAWFTGLVNKQNGFLDEAIENFESIVALDDEETRRREFDFSLDYRLLNELGQTLVERAKLERRTQGSERESYLLQAEEVFQRVLKIDVENVTAHYNLDMIYKQLGERELAAEHFALYAKYKPDDNARDRVITLHRAANPAADHAAEAITIYDLGRPGAYDVPQMATAASPAAGAP